ncbi:MAG: trehalose-phosphatase [candidate division KSB1 bacterium]|jgi:trehalose-phosphatase|nr:trehalose-phosphatase [candidate division KSB1 bacterium]
MNNQPEQNLGKIEALYKDLAGAQHSVLMLDYDGTLAPFRKQRDQAFPYNGVRDILSRIIQTKCSRVVIISGRWTEDLIPLLGLDVLPEIWGSHGIERRMPNGQLTVMEMPEVSLKGLAEAEEWIETNLLSAYSEKKPGCLALHWRGQKESLIHDLRDRVTAAWRPVAEEHNLLLHSFDGGIELRVPGLDKGHAVKTILNEVDSTTPCAYLGDDLTDEDAFKQIRGRGTGILVRKEYRPSAAEVWIKPPEELLTFLKNWCDNI